MTHPQHPEPSGDLMKLAEPFSTGVAGGTGRVIGGSASQSTSETGDVVTNGDGSALSGNVVAGQFATPVQVTGNAASWILGNGQSHGYSADTVATSGGSLFSSGDNSAGSGNVVGAPIALPVKFNCNSGAVWGSLSNSDGCNTSADATAGDTRDGSLGIPTYLETSGNDSFLSGNGGAASLSPIANVAGVAGSWIGNASAGLPESGSSSSAVDSGGFVKTAGDNASGSGNVLNPSIALPVEVFGVGGTYIGQANAVHDNTTDANAGNGSYTKGNESVLGGNIINTQAAGAPEVFGIGGSHIGNASGTATEDKTVTAGAYDGTQGANSSGSGNVRSNSSSKRSAPPLSSSRSITWLMRELIDTRSKITLCVTLGPAFSSSLPNASISFQAE